jgi:hypothetical protein
MGVEAPPILQGRAAASLHTANHKPKLCKQSMSKLVISWSLLQATCIEEQHEA